jgi:hypothetical protein
MSATTDLQALRSLDRSERVSRLFDFDPLPYQADVLDAAAKRVLWVCGRQVGKTETASVIPADYALTHADEDVMIAARFQETADELFRRTKHHIENIPLSPEQIGLTKQNETTYEFDNGSRILSRTLGTDASQQRGKLPRCIIVEEAALVTSDVYERVIRPMFLTHDDYELYLVTTPMGKSGYVWEKWNDASEDWARFHIASPDSPLTNDSELKSIKDGTDDLTWRQEYLGKFVEEGDSYLPHSLVEPCLGTNPQRGRTDRYLGVDVARKGTDRTVFWDLDSRGETWHVWAEETSTGPGIVGRIKNLHADHDYAEILIDENAVGGFAADFTQEGLGDVVSPITFTTKSKQAMYQALKRAFENEAISLPDESHQYGDRIVHELTSLQFDFTQHGRLRVYHPPGGHDDFPDALALANHGRERGTETISADDVVVL